MTLETDIAAPAADDVPMVNIDEALATFVALASAADDAAAVIEEELPWDLAGDPVDWASFAKKEPKLTKSAEALDKALEAAAAPSPERKLAELDTIKYDNMAVRKAKNDIRRVHHVTMAETRQAVGGLLKNDFTRVMALREHVRTLIDEGLRSRQVFSAIATLESHDDYLISHSMSSALFSSLVGQSLGLERKELYELAEAALLHDIGMRWIAPELVNKPGRLTEDEQFQIQRHTVFGADLLSEADGVSFASRYAAYQHHERFDGSGYPKGKAGGRIHEYARIVGMVDVYTAMTAPRAHRRKMSGYDAMKHILALSGAHFDPVVVKAFLQTMSLYPIGSVVKLTDGSIGIVVAAHPKYVYRPQIKIKRTADGADLGADGPIVDLAENHKMNIAAALSDGELAADEIWRSF